MKTHECIGCHQKFEYEEKDIEYETYHMGFGSEHETLIYVCCPFCFSRLCLGEA